MPLEKGETFFFAPRALKNLIQVDELESLSPIMTSHVSVGGEGRGGRDWCVSVMSHCRPSLRDQL